jgi:predicted transcriptional regulator
MELHRRKIRKRKPANMVITEESVALALRQAGGIQTKAALMLGVSQSAISQRVSKSEYLQTVYQEIREEMLDLAESELLKKLKEGHMSAIIFFLKCIGKSRGYTEKQEIEVAQKQGSGVLVVPKVCETTEEWLESTKNFRKKNEEKNHENRVH